MKLITIQNVAVMKQLQQSGIYIADFSRVSPNLVAPYHKMADFYGWKTCPVFCGVVGKYAEFHGAKTENSIALQLEVPDEFVRIQRYYDWTDLVFFMESPGEFHESYNPKAYPTLDSFAMAVLNNTSDGHRVLQATIPYIKAEWCTYSLGDTKELSNKHEGSGGAYVLDELKCYEMSTLKTHLFL